MKLETSLNFKIEKVIIFHTRPNRPVCFLCITCQSSATACNTKIRNLSAALGARNYYEIVASVLVMYNELNISIIKTLRFRWEIVYMSMLASHFPRML